MELNMELKFTILGVPMSKQSARFRTLTRKDGKQMTMSYQPKHIVEGEKNIKYDIKSQLPESFTPFTGEVFIEKLIYYFPPTKALEKRVARNPERTFYKTTKPDLTDNLNKALFDAMQGIVYLNDSQICSLNNVSKVYDFKPRIEIVIVGSYTNKEQMV